MSTAESFWKNKTVADMKKLRVTWRNDKRFSYDIQKIIPHLRNTKTITDLCCGTGEHIILLDQIFNFERVFVTDINEMFVFHTLIATPLTTFSGYHYNLNETIPSESLTTDTVMWLGGLIYIIDDMRVKEILDAYKGKILIIKASCYEDQEVYIDKPSEELGGQYEAKYRTKDWVLNELRSRWPVVKQERIYPSELDSKFGSKQYLFIARS